MRTFITHPDGPGPYPGVIVYMDIWGLREELYDIARRIGTVGYYVMVPDLYHRQGEGIGFEYRDEQGRRISLAKMDAATQEKILKPLGNLTNTQVMEDTGAMLEFAKQGEPVRDGPWGCTGYCLGGRMVLCALGTYPDVFRAAASLHGTAWISDRPDSPHLIVDKFKGEIYGGCPEYDPHCPPEMVRELEAMLQQHGVAYTFVFHPGAEHGYALPERDIFHKEATERDWEHIFALFHRQIPPAY